MTDRQASAERLLAEVTEPLRVRPDVQDGQMLRSRGLRVPSGFFAFVGGDGRLIVKLPEEDGQALIGSGRGENVVLGGRHLREWFALPYPDGDAEGREAWAQAAEDALEYVSSLPPRPRRRKAGPS
ncbi:hypothetical protein JL107_16605 [Nakamurella flavida]|uniref:MmcQ/YjbR family DNA-binding protein n=1 Tax=Nakamurella flavida TaxID=363630 RepID=A0A938YL89_9ACTN|nr:hypothetical protein [Nakamurella flavida]MBM9478072.1 hypothetical protein [Nakamurella flavida]MDP9778211.1 hypothetical protein [Nakamurella flavida]